jgi:cell division protein FtsB
VTDLREKVYGLKNDDRVLEKTARNELGLARPGELIVFFEDEKNAEIDLGRGR